MPAEHETDRDPDWLRKALLDAATELLKRPISRRGHFFISDADLRRVIKRLSRNAR